MVQSKQISARPKHRRDLDVIGIVVIAGIVFLHTAQIFTPLCSPTGSSVPLMSALSRRSGATEKVLSCWAFLASSV